MEITGGCVCGGTRYALTSAIWLEDKLPWVTLDESLPSFPKSSKTFGT